MISKQSSILRNRSLLRRGSCYEFKQFVSDSFTKGNKHKWTKERLCGGEYGIRKFFYIVYDYQAPAKAPNSSLHICRSGTKQIKNSSTLMRHKISAASGKEGKVVYIVCSDSSFVNL